MDSPWIFSAFLAPDGPDAPDDPGHSSELVHEMRHLRARILFDGGRRPAFREHDDQPQDLGAVARAAAPDLGAAGLLGTSGTADGRDRFHARFGFHPVASTRRYVERYTEDVVVLLHRTADRAGEYTALVDDYRLLFRELMA